MRTIFRSVCLFIQTTTFLHYFISSTTTPSSELSQYKIISEKRAYSRYRTILQRQVQFPPSSIDGSDVETESIENSRKIVDFDLVDQRGIGAVIIFAYDTNTKTATLIREYNPGCHSMLYGPAAGLVEEKHVSDEDNEENASSRDNCEESFWRKAAEWELEEECHLQGGIWHDLGEKTAMDKYVVTKVKPYLVLNPIRVNNPRALDNEEEIEIVSGITIDRVWDMVRNGEMNLVGGWACMLALQKLEELDLL